MLEKNNKISVLTKMIGIGDEKAPQLIVPQNSLTNFHARMGLSEKSVNMAGSGAQAPTISCPHCQNMAKNFLYLESLIRANGSPKNKCSLCSSTLRYVEYVNKSILDVFAKNAMIIEAARKYSTVKPRFRMPKLMSRVSRLAGGGKKAAAAAAAAAISTDSPYAKAPTTSTTTTTKRSAPKKKVIKVNESVMGKTVIVKTIPKTAKQGGEKVRKETKSKTAGQKSPKQLSKASLKTSKMLAGAPTAGTGRPKVLSVENLTKTKKIKTGKKKIASTTVKKETLKTKRIAGTELQQPMQQQQQQQQQQYHHHQQQQQQHEQQAFAA